MKNTQAPGRIYQSFGNPSKRYKQEDVFFKAWIPVIYKDNFAVMLGPQYRTEQLEFRDTGENPLEALNNWNLRSFGMDIRSYVKVDSAAFLCVNFNLNQSGNLYNHHENVPINFTFSSVFLRKKSLNKEIGFGFMANRSFGRVTVLPVFMLNYNFSQKTGIEISLPHKIAWRHNLSPTDILYIKSEIMSRAYWINGTNADYAFRRTELDMGVTYNKQITKFFGAEVFGGYRTNINTRLPGECTGVRTSGIVFSFEVYFRSPFK
ncbi:MAG TPA: DUF6268 family outer membrane beta-barrel protein [Chryseolinea sp.]|nr:DUF6268 family outer membrane beta-barrel protein [Chryseolinea sp.]